MIRPFLVIEEFTQYTGFNIEKSIVMRPKKVGKDVELIIGIITGFKFKKSKLLSVPVGIHYKSFLKTTSTKKVINGACLEL